MDFILKLLRDPSDRLGNRGVEEIKAHPFFKGTDWDNIRQSAVPYVPDVSGEADTRHFDKFEEDEPFCPKSDPTPKYRKDMDFVGYTYKRGTQRNSLVLALQELEALKASDPNKYSKEV